MKKLMLCLSLALVLLSGCVKPSNKIAYSPEVIENNDNMEDRGRNLQVYEDNIERHFYIEQLGDAYSGDDYNNRIAPGYFKVFYPDAPDDLRGKDEYAVKSIFNEQEPTYKIYSHKIVDGLVNPDNITNKLLWIYTLPEDPTYIFILFEHQDASTKVIRCWADEGHLFSTDDIISVLAYTAEDTKEEVEKIQREAIFTIEAQMGISDKEVITANLLKTYSRNNTATIKDNGLIGKTSKDILELMNGESPMFKVTCKEYSYGVEVEGELSSRELWATGIYKNDASGIYILFNEDKVIATWIDELNGPPISKEFFFRDQE